MGLPLCRWLGCLQIESAGKECVRCRVLRSLTTGKVRAGMLSGNLSVARFLHRLHRIRTGVKRGGFARELRKTIPLHGRYLANPSGR